MKKIVLFMLMLCLVLAGCSKAEQSAEAPEKEEPTVETEQEAPAVEAEVEEEPAEPGVFVLPLPENTMDNLTDAILSVSLEEGDAYVDDTGKMQMEVKIYAYDKYDMVDIAMLKVGDTLVAHDRDVEVTALERTEGGLVRINGGEEEGGLDLYTDGSGFYYEIGFNDAKNWYETGEATIRVSADFEGTDNADPEQGEIVLYPGSFLVGEVKDYNFTPQNTTIRVENGQIVELNRIFTP